MRSRCGSAEEYVIGTGGRPGGDPKHRHRRDKPHGALSLAYSGRFRGAGTRDDPGAGPSGPPQRQGKGKTLGRPKRIFRRDEAQRLRAALASGKSAC